MKKTFLAGLIERSTRPFRNFAEETKKAGEERIARLKTEEEITKQKEETKENLEKALTELRENPQLINALKTICKEHPNNSNNPK